MEKLLDNSARGARTLFWMKAFFIVSLIISALGYAIWTLAHGQINQDPQASMAMNMVLALMGMIAASIFMFVVVVALAICWISWLFRSTQNLHKLQPGKLSPLMSTVLCCVPFFGQIIHYFVLRRLVNGVQKELDSRSAQFTPVPMVMLNLYLGLTVVATILASIDGIHVVMGLGVVMGFAALVFYIRILTIFTAQEQILFKIHDEEVLRQKVDQVLREREIEKAASQVQQATFDVEPKND